MVGKAEPVAEQTPSAPDLEVTSQWADFLVRRLDPYAFAKYEILLDWLGDLRGASCLVLGCGSGEFCGLLAMRGARVHAVDVDPGAVDLAQRTAERLEAPFSVEVGDLQHYSTAETYDVVAATDVIEHIEDDAGAMCQLWSLTKPGGRLVITVPAGRFLFGYHDRILGHFRRYSPRRLRQLVSPRFRVVRMRSFGFFLIPVALLFSRLLERPYPIAAAGMQQRRKTLGGRFLQALLAFETRLHLRPGTSILLLAEPRSRSTLG